MPSNCTKCAAKLAWGNKTGLCRSCLNADRDFHARKAEAIRKAFLHHPEYRAKQRAALAESNRRPERRQQSGEQAKRLRLWEHGLPKVDAEVRARQGKTFSERRLADIPLAHRDEYRELAKRYGAKEAKRLILDHAAKVAERALA